MLMIEDRLAAAERKIAALERRLGREGPWYPQVAANGAPEVTLTALEADRAARGEDGPTGLEFRGG